MHSQYGEDTLIVHILAEAKLPKKGVYIDVGCNHPLHANNTYLLYKNGWRGICIDAHDFSDEFTRYRPEDEFISKAIASASGIAKFHFEPNLEGLSSLLEGKINTQVKEVELGPLSAIIEERGIDQIDLLSVDVEGTEIDVINSLGNKIGLPRLIIAEFNTLGKINKYLQPFLLSIGYHIISVSHANLLATRCFETDYAALPH